MDGCSSSSGPTHPKRPPTGYSSRCEVLCGAAGNRGSRRITLERTQQRVRTQQQPVGPFGRGVHVYSGANLGPEGQEQTQFHSIARFLGLFERPRPQRDVPHLYQQSILLLLVTYSTGAPVDWKIALLCTDSVVMYARSRTRGDSRSFHQRSTMVVAYSLAGSSVTHPKSVFNDIHMWLTIHTWSPHRLRGERFCWAIGRATPFSHVGKPPIRFRPEKPTRHGDDRTRQRQEQQQRTNHKVVEFVRLTRE